MEKVEGQSEVVIQPKRLRYEDKILQLLHERGNIHYSDLMVYLGVSYVTAISYAKAIANKYPNNIEYRRGKLILRLPLFPIGEKR